MPLYSQILLFFSIIVFVLGGCGSESKNKQTQDEVALGKVEITEGWVRPGMKGKASAVYLTIVNGAESADTLIGVFTDAARVAEIHTSYEDESGVISMRPAKKPTVEAGGIVRLEPDDLHIMLMELKRNLAVGDSVRLSLEFTDAGTKRVTLPVKTQ